MRLIPLFVLALFAGTQPAAAQDGDQPPRRTRVGIGPQVTPRYPGASTAQWSPYIDISRTRGDTPFTFEAPDESTGVSLYEDDRLAIGPVVGLQNSRRRRDTGGALHRVGFTVEPGVSVQYSIAPQLRARLEVRQGIGGHKGLTGLAGIDYVARDADRWLVSIGPRLTFADGRYSRAYFGITPQDATASGLAAYRPGGGVTALGAAGSGQYALGRRWGVFGYAKYDRLTGDAATSPVTRRFGSRDQWSGGVGLSYTFGRGIR